MLRLLMAPTPLGALAWLPLQLLLQLRLQLQLQLQLRLLLQLQLLLQLLSPPRALLAARASVTGTSATTTLGRPYWAPTTRYTSACSHVSMVLAGKSSLHSLSPTDWLPFQ